MVLSCTSKPEHGKLEQLNICIYLLFAKRSKSTGVFDIAVCRESSLNICAFKLGFIIAAGY